MGKDGLPGTPPPLLTQSEPSSGPEAPRLKLLVGKTRIAKVRLRFTMRV